MGLDLKALLAGILGGKIAQSAPAAVPAEAPAAEPDDAEEAPASEDPEAPEPVGV